MRTRVRSVLVLLSLSAIASSVLAQPAPSERPVARVERNTPQSAESQPKASARITGRVVARDNGAPVRRAVVNLSGSPAETRSTGPRPAYVQRALETNDNGAFEFASLPPGSYYISIPASNGFLELPRAREGTVGEGQSLDVTIRLERTGAIVGRITDRNGEGLLGVEMTAISRKDFRGHVTLMALSIARAMTNDLGQFRIFNLSPGEYFVVATPVHVQRGRDVTRRSWFVTTYYPGTQALSDAHLVAVRAGKDTSKVNFTLATGPLATVTIDAVDSRGLPLGREASATLNLLSDVYFSWSMRQTNREGDGPLVFSEVPHGDYYLIVSTSYRQEESAYVTVTIDGDVTLKVQTNSGATVAGRFVVQGPPRDANSSRSPPNVDVRATRPPFKSGPSYAKDASAHPQGTDRFELTGLRGPMVLQASMRGALLVSISRAGREDLASKPLDFTGTETIDDLLVVFTTEQAEAEVTLTGLREPDDPEKVLVMLFSEDPTRRHSGSVQYTAIEASREMPVLPRSGSNPPGRAFTFRMGPVVPGRYLIAAVPNPGVMDPTEPTFLEHLRPLAVPVTLVAGQPAPRIDVRVTR